MKQIIGLAGVAVFLIMRLRSVLGTRDGFEPATSGRAEPDNSVWDDTPGVPSRV